MTEEQVQVAVRTPDPLSRAGLTALLSGAGGLTVLDDDASRPDVLVVASDGPVDALRRAVREDGVPVVLIAEQLSPEDLLTVLRFRVRSIVPRRSVSADVLVRCVTAVAAGGGVLPADLVGRLLQQVDRLQRDTGPASRGGVDALTRREAEVLRLVAEGFDTTQIAARLSYSTRTVKNVMYGITRRLNLRNRTHAVAYALRAGLI